MNIINSTIASIIQTTEDGIQPLDPLNPRRHPNDPSPIPEFTKTRLFWSLSRILLFAAVFRLLDFPLLYVGVRKAKADWNRRKQWRLRNEITSLLHATLSGLWALSTFIIFPSAWSDMIWFYSDITFWLVLVSSGYLINDALDLIYHEQSLRTIELLFHHVSIIFALACAIFTRKYMAICACGLLMEMNSIFLHARSLLNLCSVQKDSRIYKIISVCNIGTFIIFRLSNNMYLLVWDCLHVSVMDPFYFGVLFFVMSSMLIVNLILFYRVLLADSYISSEGISCVLAPWHWVPIQAIRLRNRNADDDENDDGLGPIYHAASNVHVNIDDEKVSLGQRSDRSISTATLAKPDDLNQSSRSFSHADQDQRQQRNSVPMYEVLVPDEDADVIP